MDILAGLKDKLRFIERHYEAASKPFREVRRKIEEHEAPFEPLPFDPETATDFEPDYLEEWQEATESLNIEGQAGLKLVQAALRAYLDSFIELQGVPCTAKGANWFDRKQRHFMDVYGIDWSQAPVSIDELEEVNLARNDLEHGGSPFGMAVKQSSDHQRRFPNGLFVDEMDKMMAGPSHLRIGWPGRIEVTEAKLGEAIRRVEMFCEFLDEKRS
jgi:hypothetical protein